MVAVSRAHRQRATIALVQVLAITAWFSASAVVPTLQREWHISSTAAVWLTASVQLGFVIGAVGSVALSLADRIAPQRLMGTATACAALLTALFAVSIHSLGPAIVVRFFTGVCLASVYPVGMKAMTSWSPVATRAKALGLMLGALTLGSAMPQLISGSANVPWRGIMLTAAAVTAAGAVLAFASIRPGPYADPRAERPHPRYALAMFASRGPRLANLGYFGHMWELYALWTWLPSFVLAAGTGGAGAGHHLGLFIAIGIAGVSGCLIGGWAADRFGRPVTAGTALVISGLCCLASPLMFHAGWVPLFVFLLIWGAAVIADSGVFSTALSETADRRYVGTALTTQTAVGYLLTVVTIQFVPILAQAVGWQYAFLLLVPGPVLGAIAMRSLSGTRTPLEGNSPDVRQDNLTEAAGRPSSGNVPGSVSEGHSPVHGD